MGLEKPGKQYGVLLTSAKGYRVSKTAANNRVAIITFGCARNEVADGTLGGPDDELRTIGRSCREAPDTELVTVNGSAADLPVGRLLTAQVADAFGVDLIAEVATATAGASPVAVNAAAGS